MARKARESNQKLMSRNQGLEIPFQHTLGRSSIFGGRVLKLINSSPN